MVVMPESAMIVDSIARSNMPTDVKKSAIRKWYEGITGGISGIQGVGKHITEGGHVIRQSGEAMITGVALGLLDAEKGLDIGGIPVDGVIAGLGFVGSIAFAHDPYGICADMRNIGSDALSILLYRKAKAWREKGKTTPVSTAHGDMGDDPIVSAAKDL